MIKVVERDKPREKLGILWILPMAFFVWWVRYHPPGTDIIVFDDDARQHVYWAARFQDPDLFKDDLLTSFISSPTIDPLGYQLVYMLGTKVLDPLPLSQLLSLVLLLTSLWALGLVLRRLVPEAPGRAFGLALFLFYSVYDSSGGFPRSFAFPTFLWFLYFQLKDRAVPQAVVILLQALFYPPILLNSLAMAALDMIRRISVSRSWASIGKDIAIVGTGTALAFALLIWIYGVSDRSFLGSQVTLEEAKNMPEFQKGGRSEFFKEDLLSFLLSGRSGIGLSRILGFLIILFLMIGLGGWRSLKVPKMAVYLMGTSLMLFGLAHIVLFRLHLPSRYTIYTLPLALILIIAATTGPFLQGLKGRNWISVANKFSIPHPGAIKWGGILLGMALYAYLQGHFIVKKDTQVVTVDPVEMKMLNFLETLPKHLLIAGHPLDMNNVPLLSRRKVLVNHELSLPYHTAYYQKIRERLFDVFKAYYASSWDQIQAFIEKYNIDVLVVNKSRFHLSSPNGRIYFEPFDSFVRNMIHDDYQFALIYPPKDKICFENDRYIVLCLKER